MHTSSDHGGMLCLDRKCWEEVCAHAQDDYPSECCGIIARGTCCGPHVHRCANIQNRFHGHDPNAHPRTSRNAYRMDDLQVSRILTDTERSGGRIVAFYHSHIDCAAYFSPEDREAASFLGEPAYPGVYHLVVSTMGGRVSGRRVFHWSSDAGAFAEADFMIREVDAPRRDHTA